ncbi:MAG: polysulfide reductase NrfD [Magnetococcales bacterium]|nr:polysulfide reductase NrfD [Magnetococcales bacterium]
MLSEFSAIEGRSLGYWKVLGAMVALVLLGAASFLYVEIHGHGVTGMNNQIVWGLPHVFAISLLVMASGALNMGSMSTVFAVKQFEQFGRFSAFLSIALLSGGLAVLVLDLGRPDNMLLTMIHMNFRSMFTWNVFLYTGFLTLCLLYLWTMFEYKQYKKFVGTAAFGWRLVLTTGTGSIFGVIQGREVFGSAITAPTFVAVSLTSGTALSILLLVFTFRYTKRELDDRLIYGMRNAMIFFLTLVAYLLVVEKFTRMYDPSSYAVETWILTGPWAWLYWLGVWGLGVILPMALLFNHNIGNSVNGVLMASGYVVIGTFCFVGHTLMAGQAYPFDMFPGYTISSVFQDGVSGTYVPSMSELMLGMGGVGIAGVIYVLGIRFLRMLPAKGEAPKGWELPWNP